MPPSRQGRASRSARFLLTGRGLLRRWLADSDRGRLALLVVLTLLAGALMFAFPHAVTAAALMLPLMLTDKLLSPRRILPFVGFVIAVLAGTTVAEVLRDDEPVAARRMVSIGIVVLGGLVLLLVASRRTRLGVGGLAGDAMLMDLQERINRQGELPPLPAGWSVDVATRAAGGTSFAGDFMVAHRSDDGARLSLMLVDVSGKGVDAGTRSLLLSGAFGALLGATPADHFLAAANGFLVEQAWDEGFATAVHLWLDLRTGEYVLRSAGHPPAIQFLAGSGRWELLTAEGPILGLSSEAVFRPVTGRLGDQDALFLYTDGLVERPRRDIWLGIDKLIGEAERQVQHGFQRTAQLLVDRLGAANDDCALILLRRG